MKPVSEYLSETPREGLAAAAAVVALGIFITLMKRGGKDKKVQPEGCKLPPRANTTLPVLGNLLDMAKHQDRLLDWTDEVSRELDHQPWAIDVPGRSSMIVISSPDVIEDVMKTQDDVFLRGPYSQYMSLELFGNAMFVTDGAPWWYHRRTASHLFSLRLIKEMMADVVREELAVFVDVLNKYAARGKPISIERELSHFTMDVISKIGFGVELHTLRDGAEMEREHEYLESFDKLSAAVVQRINDPQWLWELKRKLNIGSERVLFENLQRMNNFINEIIVKSMALKNELTARGEKLPGKDLVSLFLESKLKEEEGLKIEDDDAKILRDMVVAFSFAGKDSTAHAMDWFIVFMNRHPHVVEKIREEMREKVPGLLTGEVNVPTNEQLKHLVYLEATIKEVTRLIPVLGLHHARGHEVDDALRRHVHREGPVDHCVLVRQRAQQEHMGRGRGRVQPGPIHRREWRASDLLAVRVQLVRLRHPPVHRPEVRDDGDEDDACDHPEQVRHQDGRGRDEDYLRDVAHDPCQGTSERRGDGSARRQGDHDRQRRCRCLAAWQGID
jgi:cytochrome P450